MPSRRARAKRLSGARSGATSSRRPARYLGMFGCSVRVAHDGASGLVAAVEFEPDSALVDIGLPILNGYEVAERLRRLDVAPKRIVAVSGYGQRADRAQSIEAGFDPHRQTACPRCAPQARDHRETRVVG